MVARVFIARHGETTANTVDLLQGASDSELTELGVKQSKALGRALVGNKIECIYASDLGRVKQTLRESGLQDKFKTVFVPELRERNYGILENKLWSSLSQEEKEFYRNQGTRPEGGESVEDLSARVVPWFSKMLSGKEECTLVLTHDNVISVISCFLTGLPLEKWRVFSMDNASISEFYYRNGLWRIKRFNDVCHLSRQG